MMLSQKTLHQILASANVFCNAVMFGIQLGWTAPTLVKLENDFAASSGELSRIASSHEAGRILGPFLVAVIVDKMGRRGTIAMSSMSFFICWLIMVYARSINLICCLRMLLGVTQSVTMVANALYVSENCTPNMRGLMASLYPVHMNLGILIEYMLTSYGTFEMVATANAAIGFCGCLTSLLSKETPYFLLMKKRGEMAKKNLMWLRGKRVYDCEIQVELNKISENIEFEALKKKSLVRVFTASESYKSLLIIILLNWLFFMTGHYAILAYSSMILQPSSTFLSREYTVILGIFPLITTLIVPFVIERYNRRSLFLSLLLCSGSSHICIFFLYLVEIDVNEQYIIWVKLTLIAFILAANAFLLMLASLVTSEVIPMSVKAIGNSLSVIVGSSASAITVAVFLPITDKFGIKYNFLIYSLASILLFIFCLMGLPETRGKSLVEIQESLQAKAVETNSLPQQSAQQTDF